MRKLAERGARDTQVRARARDLLPGGPDAILQWLTRRFQFVRDPRGVELLKSPQVMLEEWERSGRATGDCDDAAILGAAVALASGYRVRWVLLGFRKSGPYGHVYAEARRPRGPWVPFDVTRPSHLPAGLKVHRRVTVPLR